jgi:hypothetical protein
MLCYLIDPALRRIVDLELPNDVRGSLDEIRRIIGCKYLDHSRLTEFNDELWCDEWALLSGVPVWAFQFRNKRGTAGPFGGKCIMTGANAQGESAPPSIPKAMIENDIDWLDEILPEIHPITETADLAHGKKVHRIRNIVTWTRPK